MFWLWIHLIAWIVLAVIVIIALSSKNNNIFPLAMTARVIYLVAIISGVVLLLNAWKYAPLLASVKAVLGIGLLGLIEIAFAKKQTSKLSKPLLFSTIGCCILLGFFGLWLSQGRPFL
ncbi:hypothetical protein PL11_001440 [Lentilactobacillus curieae]|uniref:Uncharacterized protein n=1 Tax=Lentilactobacillus curieae TaxID=1138822 RepID=A0A1S6QGE8_9LACO|nr:YisL family protein [Lentilactobacillus curieae]AQW20669.1 hypothetical protein PL11_001440 [Lentilactobacillus curieae]